MCVYGGGVGRGQEEGISRQKRGGGWACGKTLGEHSMVGP